MIVSLISIMDAENASMHLKVPFEREHVIIRGVNFPVLPGEAIDLTVTHVKKDEWKIEGKGNVRVEIPCDRCLVPVQVDIPLFIDEELKMSGEALDAYDDEMPYMEGYDLDADQLICSEILIGWPVKTLCKETCLGICKTCGANRNLKPCGCEDFTPDPRMAAIRDIFTKNKEV